MSRFLDQADLEGLYALAACVVFPSLYEGFGLPVLEAMARGVPVACSNRASLPEVAGDAALLFDPEDAATIAAAIERLLGRPGAACARAGRERAAGFTWERTAELTARDLPRARVALQHALERALERQPLARSRGTRRRSRSRSAWPAACTRTIAAARSSGEAEGATNPFTPSSTSSTAALSGPATTTLGVPARGRLDHDHAVALAARGKHHAERARERALHALGAHEAGHVERVVRARARRAAGAPARARGRRRRSRRGAPGCARAQRRERGHERRHALLRDVAAGEHDERLGRARARCASSGPAYSPSSTVSRRSRPASTQPAGVEAREAERALRHAQAERLHALADPPADSAEVLAPVLAAPDLVPVDHEPEAAAAAAPTAAASSEKYGKRGGVDHVVAARRGAAGARARRRRTRAAGGSAAVPPPRRAPCAARR